MILEAATAPDIPESALARSFDVVIVGGGFYGCALALHLRRVRGVRRIAVVEREAELLARASYANQARVHGGYHYPRSFPTAFRSRQNYDRFVNTYADCVERSFTMLYAVARRNSQVTARQFVRFCQDAGAAVRPARKADADLFSPSLVEAVFEVDECAFDAARLRRRFRSELAEAGVTVFQPATVTGVERVTGGLKVHTAVPGERIALKAGTVFDCTYAGLGRVAGTGARPSAALKYELAELALIDVPEPLRDRGVTVMDGPFFSTMPFPACGLHSLSHVRYTPHLSWHASEAPELSPYDILAGYEKVSRVGLMLRDAARFMPLLGQAVPVDTLFEVKTVLVRNEVDDGRPILVESHPDMPALLSILGGKIDNVFDVFSALEHMYADVHV